MSKGNRLKSNVPGNFYVNDRCINCDTCRQLAPETFDEIGAYSAVVHQPDEAAAYNRANLALLACPTSAIVNESKQGISEAMEIFPLHIDGPVYYCGYTSERSFGGSSYLITHPDGNWLVDSPRYIPALASKLEQLGGIRYLFLTHRDDVADARKYAERFGAERLIHLHERSAQPDAEHIIEGEEPMEWKPGFRILPSPGHTKGHMLLLYDNKYLFTGDHLAWSRNRQGLTAYKDYCWYSWSEQLKSLERLQNETFEWVLPGHGTRVRLEAQHMQEALRQMLERFHD